MNVYCYHAAFLSYTIFDDLVFIIINGKEVYHLVCSCLCKVFIIRDGGFFDGLGMNFFVGGVVV